MYQARVKPTLELVAQIIDVDVQHIAALIRDFAPDLLKDEAAIEDLARVIHQVRQQGALARRQLMRQFSAPHRAPNQIQLDIEKAQQMRMRPARPAQQGGDSRRQLRDRKRLAQVVIRSALQTRHAVLDPVLHRQHEHGERAAGAAQFGGELQPASVGQADVQHNEFQRLMLKDAPGFRERLRGADRELVVIQPLDHETTDERVVIDDQHPGARVGSRGMSLKRHDARLPRRLNRDNAKNRPEGLNPQSLAQPGDPSGGAALQRAPESVRYRSSLLKGIPVFDGTMQPERRGIPRACSRAVFDALQAGRVLALPTAVAVGVAAAALRDTPLWAQPDSVAYLDLAAALSRGDFADELFLMRPPGYPLLIAATAQIAGGSAGVALLVIQRTMVVAIVALTTLTAFALTRQRGVAALAGVLTALTWPLTAYAAVILTEIPYTFAAMMMLCLLAHHLHGGSRSALACASVAAGAAGLIRPLGMPLLALCVVTAAVRWFKARSCVDETARLLGHGVCSLALCHSVAVVPGAVMLAAWGLHVRAVFPDEASGTWMRAQLYVRAVQVEGLKAPASPAFLELQRCVDEVNVGLPDGERRFRVEYPWDAVTCYRRRQGVGLTEGVRQLGDAAEPIFRAHLPQLLLTTPRHMARTLLIPDPVYRHRPDVPLVANPDPSLNVLLSTETYAASVLERVRDPVFAGRFVRAAEGGLVSRAWTAMARGYYAFVERPSRLPIPVADSFYEAWMLWALAGGVAFLRRGQRTGALLLITFALVHLFPAALTQGTIPRYAVPVQPAIQITAAAGVFTIVAFARRICMRIRLRPRRFEQAEGSASAAGGSAVVG